jgi:uncharacterized protein YpmB
MCSKTIVRLLGIILMVAGVVVIVVGVLIAIGSSWMNELVPMDITETDAIDFAADASKLGKVFEILIFVFGVYMLIMGAMACQCCGNKF